MLVAGPDLPGLPTLPASSGVALDCAVTIAEEPALLHLLNAAREAQIPVLLAACTPPARWPVHRPDLASRPHANGLCGIRRNGRPLSYFKDLRKPRQKSEGSYPLDKILLLCLLAVLTMLAGAETFVGCFTRVPCPV